jgi:hypothetical protein
MEDKNDSVQANLEVCAQMRICYLPGVGTIIAGYFAETGYHTIEDICAKTMHQIATELYVLIDKKIQNLMEMDARKNKPAYWKSIYKRCERVVWKTMCRWGIYQYSRLIHLNIKIPLVGRYERYCRSNGRSNFFDDASNFVLYQLIAGASQKQYLAKDGHEHSHEQSYAFSYQVYTLANALGHSDG